jgi:hypothetical protein
MCAGKCNISVHVCLNTNWLLRNPLFEVGEWLAQKSRSFCVSLTFQSPAFALRSRNEYPKIGHGVHIALCVLYGIICLIRH